MIHHLMMIIEQVGGDVFQQVSGNAGSALLLVILSALKERLCAPAGSRRSRLADKLRSALRATEIVIPGKSRGQEPPSGAEGDAQHRDPVDAAKRSFPA